MRYDHDLSSHRIDAIVGGIDNYKYDYSRQPAESTRCKLSYSGIHAVASSDKAIEVVGLITQQAVGQICSTNSLEHNLAQCRVIIQKAVAKGARALFLPEASDYIASSSDESRSICRPASESLFILGLREDAKKHSLPISVGVHEPSDDPQSKRIKNTLLWIDAQGEIAQRYQKVHLFDLEIPGGPVLKESDTIEPGNSILPPFDTVVGKLGSMICFDLRFPEIALALKRQGADVMVFPSAFTIPTGKAHWQTLLTARAIECQTYVIAAAQVGTHNQKRASYGHSIVIGPWGDVLAELGGEWQDEPEVAFAEIDFDELDAVRKKIPLLRRTDIYPEV